MNTDKPNEPRPNVEPLIRPLDRNKSKTGSMGRNTGSINPRAHQPTDDDDPGPAAA